MGNSPNLKVVAGGNARRSGRGWKPRSLAVVGFSLAVVLFAGVGFVYKMTEFTMTIIHSDVEGFGVAAIGIYLIGLLPIFFLTLWAIMTGRFRDIERPKFRMLELDREIERGGELMRSNHV